MNKSQLKERLDQSIEERREWVLSIGEEIYRNPETGFKEYNTARLVGEAFEQLGFEVTRLKDIPGLKVILDTGRPGPEVAVLGELDSVICPEHPDSDKRTGAVHACGHNIQIAAMLGAAAGLKDPEVAGTLAGRIHFIAVPAEEYIEVELRKGLKDRGIIKYLGGKPELLHRGMFKDVQMSIMLHSFSGGDKKIGFGPTNNGCLVKKIRYLGKASHAGGAPHEGINALYAANLGLTAINAIRETFTEQEYIRVHPIITKGGDIVNVIPSEVCIETFVRGRRMEDILKANKKVNRALVGGAIALGAKVEIEDIPGYFPLACDSQLAALSERTAKELVEEAQYMDTGHGTGSTDLGDLSTVMPVAQLLIGGTQGGYHSADYRITDPETAYILGARLLARMTAELLWEDGETAREIVDGYSPLFSSPEEYFEFADKLFQKRVLPEQDIY